MQPMYGTFPFPVSECDCCDSFTKGNQISVRLFELVRYWKRPLVLRQITVLRSCHIKTLVTYQTWAAQWCHLKLPEATWVYCVAFLLRVYPLLYVVAAVFLLSALWASSWDGPWRPGYEALQAVLLTADQTTSVCARGTAGSEGWIPFQLIQQTRRWLLEIQKNWLCRLFRCVCTHGPSCAWCELA